MEWFRKYKEILAIVLALSAGVYYVTLASDNAKRIDAQDSIIVRLDSTLVKITEIAEQTAKVSQHLSDPKESLRKNLILHGYDSLSVQFWMGMLQGRPKPNIKDLPRGIAFIGGPDYPDIGLMLRWDHIGDSAIILDSLWDIRPK